MWQRYNGTSKIFEFSTDDGGSWDPLELDAAIISQGSFAKAQQHAQTAYKDAGNVFSAAANEFAEILLVDKGLKFPAAQVASADANTLDDYQEENWTPAMKFGGASIGLTYATQTGRATKVGREVTLEITITLTAKGSSVGVATITGLPAEFTPAINATGVIDYASLAGMTGVVPAIVVSGTTLFLLGLGSGAATRVQLSEANFTNTSSFTFNIKYTV